MDAAVTAGRPQAAPPSGEAVRAPSPLTRLVLGVVFLGYMVATALLFFFGPWVYRMPAGATLLVTFLVGVHILFGLGYTVGALGTSRHAHSTVSIDTIVLVCVLVDLALLLPTSAYNTGFVVPAPWTALLDLGTTYTESLARREQGTPYVNYARMLAAPLLAALLPLAIFYWDRLRDLTRILFVWSTVGTLALFVAMGANAGVAHWMALFPWFVLARRLSATSRRPRQTSWTKPAVLAVVSVVVFVMLFAATMTARRGSFALLGDIPGIGARLEHPEGRSTLRIAFDGLAGYLTQGYYAVYLSLQEPFVPTYGIGHSVFLQRQYVRITGDATILDRPYPVRIESRGWNAYGYWASIYPWLASDVTFPGVVLVMGAIGWMAGAVWADVLGGRNPYAVAFLGQILMLLYYVPAHNKVMHSGEGVLAFVTLGTLWGLSRTRLLNRGRSVS